MEATLRILEPEDAQDYVGLRRAMLEDSPLSFLASPETDFASKIDAVRERLARGPSEVTFGAFTDKLVGAVGIFPEHHPKAAHKIGIWGMFVSPEVRGQGIGRQLLDTAIAHIKHLDGVSQIFLSVSASAPGAQKLYESVGFRVWGKEPRAIVHGGEVVDEHHMTLLFDE